MLFIGVLRWCSSWMLFVDALHRCSQLMLFNILRVLHWRIFNEQSHQETFRRNALQIRQTILNSLNFKLETKVLRDSLDGSLRGSQRDWYALRNSHLIPFPSQFTETFALKFRAFALCGRHIGSDYSIPWHQKFWSRTRPRSRIKPRIKLRTRPRTRPRTVIWLPGTLDANRPH